MRLETLLIHRCDLLIPGEVIGVDDYGRDIIGNKELKDIPCRFDRVKQEVVQDETSRDFIFVHMMIFNKDVQVSMETRILNIRNKLGAPLIEGSFAVSSMMPIYDRSTIHHYEVTVKRE